MSNDIMSQRVLRLLTGLLLPCPIALFLYLLPGAIAEADSSILGLLTLFPIAYYIAGLQSFLYSLIMEYYVWPAVGRNYLAILVSTLLGAICGLSVSLITHNSVLIKSPLIIWLLSGSFAGLITGLVLYHLRKDYRTGSPPEIKVKKKKIQIFLSVFIPIIIICLLVVLELRRPGPLRLLGPEETRKMVKSMTGRKLPPNAEELRGIFHDGRFIDCHYHEFYAAFKTDQEGISHILNTFGGEDVLMEDFPNAESNPFDWKMMDLLDVYSLQKELGVVLLDNDLNDLIDRIRSDDLEYARTKRYPEDAVSGWYLEFRKRHTASFNILIFKDRGLVYIRIMEDL